MNDTTTELLEEETESDGEEEEMEEECVPLWKDLFPESDSTHLPDPQMPSTPPHFPWNVSAPTFVPDLKRTALDPH